MKLNRDNFWKFFDRKGFYIVLFMCIVVVGVTAVYVTNNNIKKLSNIKTAQEEMKKASSNSGNLVTEYPRTTTNAGEKSLKEKTANKEDTSKNTTASTVKPNETTKNTISTKDNGNTYVKTVSNNQSNSQQNIDTNLALAKPVNGDVIMEFAKDKLTYSKTLDEWTTHNGVDLKAAMGTNVFASMNGVVTKVYRDLKLGNTVEIKNGSYVTCYSNLDDEISVKTGQEVKKGDIIGKVGKSAKFEIAEDPHVHFELMKDGTYVDPMQYFK